MITLHDISFNPFDRNIEELEPTNLALLTEVAEGWYIEYKKEMVTSKNIAKSISSFANHYGGWIFYGVEESDDGRNLAGAFPGIEISEVSLLVNRIRDAVRNSINPTPFYRYRILDGPCEEIGLRSGRSIVIVSVSMGANAPYIHSDGRIYRRIADSSDPKPETDRFILDQLWQRGEVSRNILSSLLESKPLLSDAEEKSLSYINLFLLPDPFNSSGSISKLKFEEFIEIMSAKSTKPGIPCDNFFTMSDGFVGRQVNTNDPYIMVFTWKYFYNGSSIISIPFSSASVEDVCVRRWLHGYEQEARMITQLRSQNFKLGRILDVNILYNVILGVLELQLRLMRQAGLKGAYYAKAALHNIWRKIPYLDTESYIEFIQEHGIPLIQTNDEFAPPGQSYESLRIISKAKDSKRGDQFSINATDTFRFIADIGYALGLSPLVSLSDKMDWLKVMERVAKRNRS